MSRTHGATLRPLPVGQREQARAEQDQRGGFRSMDFGHEARLTEDARRPPPPTGNTSVASIAPTIGASWLVSIPAEVTGPSASLNAFNTCAGVTD